MLHGHLALLMCLSCASDAVRLKANQDLHLEDASVSDSAFEDDLVGMLRESVGAMFGAATGAEEPSSSDLSEPHHSRPEVAFDETWFADQCDLGASPTRNGSFYKQEEWRPKKKCELGYDHGGDLQEFTEDMDQTKCSAKCQEIADADPGNTYCCEWDGNDGKCTVAKSFLAIEDSSKGTGLNWLKNKEVKYAKFVRGASEVRKENQGNDLNLQLKNVDESKEMVKKLVEQVNHMSIDGILRHLLSFYICMRWVPDDQFIKLTQFEMENVDVDKQTERTGEPVTEDEAIAAYANMDAVPLKCSSGMSVQNTQMIDKLLDELDRPSSSIKEAYEYSKRVAQQSWSSTLGISHRKWSGSVASIKERMGMKAETAEMNRKARRVLPWDQFIRASHRFTWRFGSHETHVSEPDNLFFICFGPRVSSFPHKRENGGHFLADSNMAGCNGLWSFKKLHEHVARVRQLFDPRTCLTEKMRRKLKMVFLETFVDMNQNFEQKLLGNFFTRREGMETIPPELLPKTDIAINETVVNNMEKMNQRYVAKKYERTGRLVAGAHTKWIVCDAKVPDSPAQGFASSFFNTPEAYRKWFDANLPEQNLPECKTYDEATGCQKCVFEVNTYPFRCLHRLGLTAEQIMTAIKKRMRPLVSNYESVKPVVKDDRNVMEISKESGVCLISKELSQGDDRLRDEFAYQKIKKTDRVYKITPSGANFQLEERYTLNTRMEADREAPVPVLSEEEKRRNIALLQTVAGKVVEYPMENFAKVMTFGEVIPAESNIPSHIIEYFYTCPCEPFDFEKTEEYVELSTKRITDYYVD